jgi:hypothetical protein
MLEVVTHAGHHAHEYWLQHRGGQFDGKSRVAADGDPQQSAAVAVRHTVGFAEAQTSSTISTRVFAN